MDLKIQNKFSLKSKIGSGAFGEVYLAENTETHEFVAVKLEPNTVNHSQLLNEKRAYARLNGCVGIPRVHWYGKEGDYNVLIIDLLGSSLQQLFVDQKKKFTLKTVLMIALQVLARIETIHKKGLIHRDIKPENFVVGFHYDNQNVIYAIDFGISERYIDQKTGKHIEYADGKSLTGTARYVSRNVHKGIEPTRRDDMESIAYMLIYLLKGNLPWAGIKCETKEEKYKKIYEKKKQISSDILCSGIPHEFQLFLDDVKRLDYADEPHYALYRKFFTDLFIREGFVYDYKFDWTTASTFKSPPAPFSIISGPSSPAKTPTIKFSPMPSFSQHSSIYESKELPFSNKRRYLQSECRSRNIAQSQDRLLCASKKKLNPLKEHSHKNKMDHENPPEEEKAANHRRSVSGSSLEQHEIGQIQQKNIRRVKLYPAFVGTVVKPSLRTKQHVF